MDIAKDGEEAIDMAQAGEYDLMILDVLLPKKSGLEVLKTLPGEKVATPTLILTAKDDVDDRVKGLDAGADDYLTKPFGFDELLAEHVWEQDFDPLSNVIDVHIARLRRKIDDSFRKKYLQTMRGTGYTLKDPDDS